MSNACTPILVGMAILVSEILLPSKTAKFSFWTMGYSPWSSKNFIDWNRLKKFMQVGIDVKCMHTNFCWHCLFSFGYFVSLSLVSRLQTIITHKYDTHTVLTHTLLLSFNDYSSYIIHK